MTLLPNQTNAGTLAKTLVVDTDVHEHLKSVKDLVPYLDEPWKGLVVSGTFSGLGSPYATWNKKLDAEPPSGGPLGSDLPFLRKQLLEEYQISKAILTGMFYPATMEMQFEFAAALASAYNSWMIEHWLDKDDRFLGSVQIAPQEPQLAAREIDRVGSHPRMVQVLMPVAQWAYGDPMYHPIYEAAERNNLAIAFHQSKWVKGPFGFGRYYVERHMTFPGSGMSTLASLFCNGVFDKFPKLRFVMLELGFTWLNHVMWRFDREYRQLRHEIPWVKGMPSEYFLERVRFSTQPVEDISGKQLMDFLNLIGTDDILMFATDYPHFDFDSPTNSIPAGVPQSTREKILYKTACEFYNLTL